jgi:hypothetical protein
LLLGFVAAASACTVCDSNLGQEVRAGIFEKNFWRNLFAVIAPFPAVLVAVAVVQRGLFRSDRERKSAPEASR